MTRKFIGSKAGGADQWASGWLYLSAQQSYAIPRFFVSFCSIAHGLSFTLMLSFSSGCRWLPVMVRATYKLSHWASKCPYHLSQFKFFGNFNFFFFFGGEQGGGFYSEIKWDDRAPSSRQGGTRESLDSFNFDTILNLNLNSSPRKYCILYPELPTWGDSRSQKSSQQTFLCLLTDLPVSEPTPDNGYKITVYILPVTCMYIKCGTHAWNYIFCFGTIFLLNCEYFACH